jgi:hypothetical protein
VSTETGQNQITGAEGASWCELNLDTIRLHDIVHVHGIVHDLTLCMPLFVIWTTFRL